MKRLRSITVMLSLLLLVTNVNIVKASEIASNTDYSDNDTNKILREFGYEDSIIEILSEDKRTEIANAIKDNPENVKLFTTIIEIDNLEQIEYLSNTPNEELISAGVSEEKIQMAREDLQAINNLSDEELANEFNTDSTGVYMLREALEPNENYIIKDIDNIATASGTISSTMLTYTQGVINYSTSTAPNYDVTLAYRWNSLYLTSIFDQKIVVGWGGNLATKNIASSATYYKHNGINWVSGSANYSWSKVENPINAGLVFTTPQSKTINSYPYKNRWGSATFDLYQTKKQGYASKVVSSFAHKKTTIDAGISISASGPSVSLDIGSAYDTSAQKSNAIIY